MTPAASNAADHTPGDRLRTGALPRETWFGWAFLILAANAAMTTIVEGIVLFGPWQAAFDLFEISAVVWVAIAAGAALLLGNHARQDESRLQRWDVPLLALAGIAALLPFPPASAVAATALAAWLVATSAPRSPTCRGALIFAAVMTNFLWGRLAVLLGGEWLLAIDAAITGAVAGTGGQGNVVNFAGGGTFVIATGCSSVQGISLAIVLWVTVTQYFDLRVGARAWWTLGATVLAAFSVNVVRLAAMATWPDYFRWLHQGTGAALFGWAGLLAILLVTWIGLRDDLLARD